MRLSIATLALAGAVGVGLLALTGMTGKRARSAPFPYQANDKLITIDGVNWESQAEFVHRGGRCIAEEPDINIQDAVQKRLKRFRLQKQRRLHGIETASAQSRAPGSITISVWFHVITNTGGAGNVSDAQLQSQIDELNLTYSGQDVPPAGVAPLGATTNTAFRFTLAGIDRTVNNAWYTTLQNSANETAMKTALHKGDAKTLNIYLCNPTGVYGATLGWATWPVSYAGAPLMDGLVILNGTLPGGAKAPYNQGKTVVHESGHWLGLYHTFQGACSTRNDFIDDTPAERTAHYGIFPPQPDTCTQSYSLGKDPVDNYMDYGDDAYIVRFTPSQSAAMDDTAALYRGL